VSLRFLPNAICVLRILLVAPLVAAILEGRHVTALALIVIAGASDGLDGFLAKRFDWRTRLGGLLDPAADKLLLVSTFVALAYVGAMPQGVVAIVVGRDIVIVSGAICYQLFIAPLEAEPALISKLNTACQLAFGVLTLTFAAFGWPSPSALLLLGAAVVFTSLVSGLNYVLRWSTRAWRVAHRAA